MRIQLGFPTLALLCSFGCAPTQLAIDPEPATARVLIDGVDRGDGPTTLSTPYYGTVEVAAATPPPRALDEPAARGTRQLVDVRPPVTPWVFPFDLFGEALVRAFGAPQPVRTTLAVPQPAPLEPGETPADLDGLRARAQAMRDAR